jgi:adenine deaminase
MEVVREEVRRVEESLRNNGVAWEKPMLTVDTLGSPAIPHLKISHEGYVRLRDQKILPLQV